METLSETRPLRTLRRLQLPEPTLSILPSIRQPRALDLMRFGIQASRTIWSCIPATTKAPFRMVVRAPMPSHSLPLCLSTHPISALRSATPATASRSIRKVCPSSALTAIRPRRSLDRTSINASTTRSPTGSTTRIRPAISCLRRSTSRSQRFKESEPDRAASPHCQQCPLSFPTNRTTCTTVRSRRPTPG